MAPRTKRISEIMFVFLFQPQLGAASVHQSLVFQQDSSCKARRALAGHPREFLSLFVSLSTTSYMYNQNGLVGLVGRFVGWSGLVCLVCLVWFDWAGLAGPV